MNSENWIKLNSKITQCSLCPRLIKHCQKIAQEKKRAFMNEKYWGKPVPGFGDTKAELIILGLAPAAHGANRTGRMFTGDQSGLWLYRALYKAGLSNQSESLHMNDSLKLKNTFITASARCAPPMNKPNPKEFQNCFQYLEKELDLLQNKKTFIVLGKIAFDTLWKFLVKIEEKKPIPIKPKFQHGKCFSFESKILKRKISIILSFHPSQQNTFTKKLTEPMFDSIFMKAKKHLKLSSA